MKRVWGVTKFLCVRRLKPLLILFLVVLVAVCGVSAVTSTREHQTYVSVSSTGQTMYYANALSTDQDYTPVGTLVLVATAILAISRERKYLLSLSVSRREILLGHAIAMLIIAFFTLIACDLLSICQRLIMVLCNYPKRGGWSVTDILLGSNLSCGFEPLFMRYFEYISVIGGATLLATLFSRWRKQILIITAALVGIFIALVIQVNLTQYAGKATELLYGFAEWLEYSFIPFIEKILSRQGAIADWQKIFEYTAFFAGAMILSYPILRRLKSKV